MDGAHKFTPRTYPFNVSSFLVSLRHRRHKSASREIVANFRSILSLPSELTTFRLQYSFNASSFRKNRIQDTQQQDYFDPSRFLSFAGTEKFIDYYLTNGETNPRPILFPFPFSTRVKDRSRDGSNEEEQRAEESVREKSDRNKITTGGGEGRGWGRGLVQPRSRVKRNVRCRLIESFLAAEGCGNSRGSRVCRAL